jgi:outer membrane lipoprotein SlyB
MRALRPAKIVAISMGLIMVLNACGTTGSGGETPPVSASQAALRSETETCDSSAFAAAAAGAILGAVAGALICGKDNAVACAGAGAVAGGAVGAAAGCYVSVKNQQYANREEAIRARIYSANLEVNRYDKIIANSNRVIAQHRTSISRLNSRYSAGTANKSDYRRQIDAMEEDHEAIRQLIAENRRTVTAIQSDINAIGGVRGAALVQDRDRLIEQRLILQQQMAILQRLMDESSAIT